MTAADNFSAGPEDAQAGAGVGRTESAEVRGASLLASVAQIIAVDGRAAGAGFVVGEDTVVTCAHVVHAAGQGPGGRVDLIFPHVQGAPRVAGHVLADQWRAPQAQDVALVRLECVPTGIHALSLGSAAGCRGHRVSAYGFPAQAPQSGHFGYGTAGDLLPDSEAGQLLQLSEANDLTTGFSGGPIVDEVTGLVIGMVTAITTPDSHLKGLNIAYATPVEVLREVRPDLTEQQVRPYRGLEPFTMEHAAWFHGRETVVEAVLTALQDRRRLLLLGPSGAGKSSLVQAGVLPALAEGALPGSDRWLPLLARPGQDLATELERAGLPGASTDGLLTAAERRLATERDHDRLLLVIDQFEEHLTQPQPTLTADGHGPNLRRAAVQELVALMDSQAPVTVLLIMRDDFYPRLAALAPNLLEAMTPGLLNVPATLSRTELHAIITRPAQAAGARIEDGLPERIITDILATNPARQAPITLLPPLELALSQLWDRREDGRLTHDAYQRIGEVTGTLAAWCNSAVTQLPADQRTTAKRILTALVRPADESHGVPATRQQVPLSRLRALTTGSTTAGPAAADEAFDAVVATLSRDRIIITGSVPQSDGAPGVPVAELIHDALLRDWSDLRDWVAQDHRFQVWLHRTAEQQARHVETRHAGDLLAGSVLAEGLDWARQRSLPDDITVFLNTSHQHQQTAARRARRLNIVLACMLALALIATGTAFWQRQTAITAQHQAQSRALATYSDALLDTDPDLASLLAVQAHRTSPTAEATGSLYRAAALPLRSRFTGPKDMAESSVFSPDGKTLATGANDGTVRLWDVTSGTARTLRSHTSPVLSVAFSKNGRTLTTSGLDGTVQLWDVASGTSRTALPSHLSRIPSGDHSDARWVGLSPDGKTQATKTEDSKVRLWDVASGTSRTTLRGLTGLVLSAEFSPDGKTLAVNDGSVRLWDVASGTSRMSLHGDTSGVNSVAFSPDGRTLATSNFDGLVRLWDVASGTNRILLRGGIAARVVVGFGADGKTLATATYDDTLHSWDGAGGARRIPLRGATSDVGPLGLSPDGKTLATSDRDGTVRLWDVASGTSRMSLRGDTSGVNSVAFSPDGKTLATGSDDKTARLWDVASGTVRTTLRGHTKPVSSVAFSPDGKTLATGSHDKTARLWDVASGTVRTTLRGGTDAVQSVTFSPNGQTLAAGGEGASVRLWDVASGALRVTLTGHTNTVTAVVFSPDGKTLATGSDDETARLWHVSLPDAAEAEQQICRAVRRDFTKEERSTYLGGQATAPVCPDTSAH